jgi:CDP-diacylglycerol--serine O-phosphatidyltransferase
MLTLCAVLCGVTAIRLSGEGRPELAMAAIFGAVVLDFADGYAAHRLSAVTAIGAQLDSLADFVNFGAAPALLLYWTGLYRLGFAGWVVASIYVLATAIRLARFNVQSKAASAAGKDRRFCGLPSTGAAASVLIANAVATAALKPAGAAILIAAASLGASALMVSRISVPSLAVLFARDGAGSKDR